MTTLGLPFVVCLSVCVEGDVQFSTGHLVSEPWLWVAKLRWSSMSIGSRDSFPEKILLSLEVNLKTWPRNLNLFPPPPIPAVNPAVA